MSHLTSPVVRLDDSGQPLGWYPFCATCDKFGARMRDEAMAAEACRDHEATA